MKRRPRSGDGAQRTRPASRRRRTARVVKSVDPIADNPIESGPGGFAIPELRRLIRLVQRTGIGELEVTSGGRTVRIAAHPTPSVSVATAPVEPSSWALAQPATGPGGGTSAAGAEDRWLAITSPMVGTFYRSPAPDAEPYVEVGTVIEPGQTVCIVEAMKLMNEIESEMKGRIVRVLVENSQAVEFGQKLFLVEPL